MPQEILSVAIYEPLPEMEAASLATIRELIALLSAKGYSSDLLYHGGQSEYVLLRYWGFEQSCAVAGHPGGDFQRSRLHHAAVRPALSSDPALRPARTRRCGPRSRRS